MAALVGCFYLINQKKSFKMKLFVDCQRIYAAISFRNENFLQFAAKTLISSLILACFPVYLQFV